MAINRIRYYTADPIGSPLECEAELVALLERDKAAYEACGRGILPHRMRVQVNIDLAMARRTIATRGRHVAPAPAALTVGAVLDFKQKTIASHIYDEDAPDIWGDEIDTD